MRALVLPALAALALSGCATEIDDKKTEAFIAKSVREQVGARVESVSCPTGLTARKGDTFECTVTGSDGTSGEATVTMKDDEGNVSASAPFIHVRNLEQQIAVGISEQVGGSDIELSCPEIVVGKKGDRFECEATSGSDEATVEVTQTDDQGNVDYKLKR